MKRTPLVRRRLWRPKPRPEAEKVTPEQVAEALAKWGGCILVRIEPEHECADKWGNPHRPDQLDLLEMDHLKMIARMGKRGEVIVPMCSAGNHRPPTAEQRRAMRELVREQA
jgi:hypothetical protein